MKNRHNSTILVRVCYINTPSRILYGDPEFVISIHPAVFCTGKDKQPSCEDNSDYRYGLVSGADHYHYPRHGGQERTAASSSDLSLDRRSPSSWRLARHLTSALERLHKHERSQQSLSGALTGRRVPLYARSGEGKRASASGLVETSASAELAQSDSDPLGGDLGEDAGPARLDGDES